jgi:pyridoxal phosphate enzyme (YggS family)
MFKKYMDSMECRLQQVEERIRHASNLYARQIGSISLIAVSKKQSIVDIVSAYEKGIKDFGENYAQEALPKINALSQLNLHPSWHFIGTLQSNKIRIISHSFSWVHTVQTLQQAHLLHTFRSAEAPKLNICLQYNVREHPPFSGILSDELYVLASEIQKFSRLQLRGLMCLPAPTPHFDQQRTSFKRCRMAFESLKTQFPMVDTLSMGMSNDLEAAIAEKTNFLRIGTAIFGPRPAIR